MRLKDAFYSSQKMPMPTVQKQINRRKSVSSKFVKMGKAFKKLGRRPYDKKSRVSEPIPPTGK